MSGKAPFQKLLQSSLAAARRAVAWRIEDLSPPPELVLFDFSNAAHHRPWTAFADSRYGGSSEAALSYPELKGGAQARSHAAQGNTPTYLRFSGSLLVAPRAQQGGWAAAAAAQDAGTPSPQSPGGSPGHESGTQPGPHPASGDRPGEQGGGRPTESGTSTSTSSASADSGSSVGAAEELSHGGRGGGSEDGATSGPGAQGAGEGGAPAVSPLRRSGFAYMRTLEGDNTVQYDLDAYDALVFHARGDGQAFIASIRTDSWVCGPGESAENTWQAAVVVPPGPRWTRVEVPLSSFVHTWKGRVLPEQGEMNKGSVVGLGLAACVMSGTEGFRRVARGEGAFALDLLSISAVIK